MDRHCFDADPDTNFHFDADPDLDPDPTPSLTHIGKSEFFLSYFYLSRQCHFCVIIFCTLDRIFSGEKYRFSLHLVDTDTDPDPIRVRAQKNYAQLTGSGSTTLQCTYIVCSVHILYAVI